MEDFNFSNFEVLDFATITPSWLSPVEAVLWEDWVNDVPATDLEREMFDDYTNTKPITWEKRKLYFEFIQNSSFPARKKNCYSDIARKIPSLENIKITFVKK